MSSPVQKFLEKQKQALLQEKQAALPEIRPGDRVKVWTKVEESGKERLTPFEGVVIARKHGSELGATITVRAEISGYGVERIFPLYAPTVAKIELLKRSKVRRAKLYYLRGRTGRKARMQTKEIIGEAETQTKGSVQKQENEDKVMDQSAASQVASETQEEAAKDQQQKAQGHDQSATKEEE